MKTRKSFKGILSLVLLTAIFSLSLASVSFADASTVTWKETFSGADQQIAEVYDAETGTFGTTGRVINYTNTSGSQSTYIYGAVLPEEVTCGTVTVEAELSGVSFPISNAIHLFTVSDSTAGWKVNTALQSELVFRGSTDQVQLTSTNALNDTYRARFNTDLITLTSGSGVKLNSPNGVQKLKFVAEAANESANWNISIYHLATSDKAPVYTYTIARSVLPDLKYVFNYDKINNNASLGLTVKEFKVTTSTTPEIVTATDGNVAYNAPLSVTFDSAMDESTIREIKLMQGDTAVAADVTLDETTKKTVTIDPASDLVDGEDYQIVIPATVKGANGLSVEATAINVTAIDALYFTNLASQYNPSAVVNEDHEPDRHSIENNKLVLGHGTKSMGMYKFVIPAAETGVYYADVKFSVINVNNNDDKVRLCAGSNDILVATGTTEFLAPSEAMNYAVNSSDANVYKSNGIYDLRFIIMSDSSSANWKVLLLNKATGAITHGGIISRENLAAFNQLYIEVTSCAAEVSEIVIRKADDVNLINPAYNSAAKQMTGTVATAKSGVAIAAAYAADGRFLQAVSTPLNPSSSAPDVINVTFTTNEAIAETKLMVWDGFTGCKPLLLNPFE